MVGIVVVSHSDSLANATAELARLMGTDARIACAGGLSDGGFGTSEARIRAAIDQVASPGGTVLICDIGSAVLTAQLLANDIADEQAHHSDSCTNQVVVADCPFVEGAVEAAVQAPFATSARELAASLSHVWDVHKL